MEHELKLYETEDGACPVSDYLRGQSKRVRGEAGWLLERLEREGNSLERPVTDFLDDGIYELRVIVDRQQHRILYFFNKEIIVATHGFLKKTPKVPKEQIERAKRIRADWLAREEETRRK